MAEDKLKVCFITPRASKTGGAEESLLTLIDYLLTKNVEVKVITFEKEGTLLKEFDYRKVEYLYIPCDWWVKREWETEENVQNKFKSIFETSVAIAGRIKKWNSDVVYTNSIVTNVGSLAAVILDKPHIWHIREALTGSKKYSPIIPFEQMALHITPANNFVIFISKFIEKEYQKYLTGDNSRV